MNIVFFGSSKYSTIVAEALYKEFGLNLVVTIPDKLTGRKKILTPSPVKEFALRYNIPVLTFEKLNERAIEEIKNIHFVIPSDPPAGGESRNLSATDSVNISKSDISSKLGAKRSLHSFQSVGMTNTPDFIVVTDYRLILPNELLKIPKYAPLNVHHSLLPKYRGPSPAPAAILAEEAKTGVSIIIMKDKVDAGDILVQKEYTMKPDETTDSLLTELNTLGAKIIIPVIKDFKHYYKNRIIQKDNQATFTSYMKKADGYIDISKVNNLSELEIRNLKFEIARKLRAYYPWPGVWTELKTKNKELRIKLLPEKNIQPEGKKPMTIKDFLNGYPEAKQILEQLFGEKLSE